MKKPKSQSDRILAHLISGKPLTAMQALDKFGCFRLAARIGQLRKEWTITTEMKTKDGKRFAVYRISPISLAV
jgi:hypothetical protein